MEKNTRLCDLCQTEEVEYGDSLHLDADTLYAMDGYDLKTIDCCDECQVAFNSMLKRLRDGNE